MKKLLIFVLSLSLTLTAYSQCSNLSIASDKQTVCAPELTSFSVLNANDSCSFLWNLGYDWSNGGRTTVALYEQADTLDIIVIVTYPSGSQCTLQEQNFIVVHKKPEPVIDLSKAILCNGPDELTFTDLSSNIASRNWIIDGTNYKNAASSINHKFTTSGTKSISIIVIDSFGCQGLIQYKDTIKVYESPAIDFYADVTKGCTPLSTQIYVEEDPSLAFNTNYSWLLNGSSKDSANGATTSELIYSSPGKYDLGLNVEVANGCTYSIIKKEFIKVADAVALSLSIANTDVCVNTPVTITLNESAIYGNSTWTFSGISTSNTEIDNLHHSVSPQESGLLNIHLVNTYNGCKSTLDTSIYISTKGIKANFSSTDNYHCQVPHKVHLSNTSPIADDSVDFIWNIYKKDSLIHTANTLHDSMEFFVLPAKYDVELIAISSNGCTDTLRKNGFIYQDSLYANFKPIPEIACIGQEIQFSNNTKASTYLEEDLFNWTFYGLNGNTLDSSNQREPSMTYYDTGFYTVRLIGYNNYNCIDTLELNSIQIIDPIPGFSITDSIVCLGEKIHAIAQTAPSVELMRHNWTLTHLASHKTKSFSGTEVEFKPWDPGEYQLLYSFQIENGCYKEDSISIYVNGISGEISLEDMQSCAPYLAQPQFVSQYNYHYGNSETNISYNWSVVPSQSVLLSNGNYAIPNITFQKNGSYTINLEVENSTQCKSKINLSTIQVGPTAKFSILNKNICYGDTLYIKNRSVNENTNYNYQLKNNSNYELFYTQTFDKLLVRDSGNFTLDLIAEMDSQCQDTASLKFNVIKVVADFSSTDTFLKCAPVYVQFQNKSINYDSLFWDFGDGSKFATTENSAGTIYKNNTDSIDGFDVQLIATNKFGCKDTSTKVDFVVVSGPRPKFSMSNTSGCETAEVSFENLSKGGTHILIDYKDGSPLDSSLSKHTFNKLSDASVEKFFPVLFVSDDNGCVASYKSKTPVTLYKNPTAKFSLPDLNSACAPYLLELPNESENFNSSNWFLNSNWLSSDKDLNSPINKHGDNTITLHVSNSHACVDSISANFTIYGAADIALVLDDTLCLHKQLDFKALVNYDPQIDTTDLQIVWNFGEENTAGNSVNNNFNPQFTYNTPGFKTVKINVTTSRGCTTKKSKSFDIRGPQDLESPQINYLSFVEGYDLMLNHQASTDAHFSAYKYERSDGEVFINSAQTKANWINEFTTKPDSVLCYDINILDECGMDGLKSVKHCFMYLHVQSLSPFSNTLNWTKYVGWQNVSAYRIFRRSSTLADFDLIATVDADINEFTDKGLCDIDYEYFIQALDASSDAKSNSFTVSQRPIIVSNNFKSAIKSASVKADKLIEINWDKSEFSHFDHYRLTKYDEANRLISSIDLQDNYYLDYDVLTSEYSYIYTIQEVDQCGSLNEAGRIGKTMLLKASYDNNKLESNLSWTAYEEWENGVETYLIKLETAGIIARVSSNSTSYIDHEYHDELSGEYCYQIIAINAQGDSSYSNKVCVNGDPISFIPNAFSPNSDGLNESFKPVCRFVNHQGEVFGYQMEVYNRWGQLIFQSNDLINGWDGRYNEVPCAQGAYLYDIQYRGADNRIYHHHGTVTIVK